MPTLHMRYPGGLAKAVTFSYDDGVTHDIRLSQILDKYGLKGTFNINTNSLEPGAVNWKYSRMPKEQVTKLFKGSDHEVAVHTLNHPYLQQLPCNMATYEVLEDRRRIEDMFGTVCRGMAYPSDFTFGPDSQEIVDILKACGILYARTGTSSNSLVFPSDWLRLMPTCHHKSEKLNELADTVLNESCVRTPWLLYVWGHSYEFDADDNWELIESFAEKISGRDDIWYATNIEIFEYAEAYKQLRFSCTGDRVFNPTCFELFFCDSRKGRNYSVKPGETLEIKI